MAGLILSFSFSLSVLILAVFTVIVVSIRRDDHARTLTSHPDSRVQATTRRLLGVGIRSTRPDGAEE